MVAPARPEKAQPEQGVEAATSAVEAAPETKVTLGKPDVQAWRKYGKMGKMNEQAWRTAKTGFGRPGEQQWRQNQKFGRPGEQTWVSDVKFGKPDEQTWKPGLKFGRPGEKPEEGEQDEIGMLKKIGAQVWGGMKANMAKEWGKDQSWTAMMRNVGQHFVGMRERLTSQLDDDLLEDLQVAQEHARDFPRPTWGSFGEIKNMMGAHVNKVMEKTQSFHEQRVEKKKEMHAKLVAACPAEVARCGLPTELPEEHKKDAHGFMRGLLRGLAKGTTGDQNQHMDHTAAQCLQDIDVETVSAECAPVLTEATDCMRKHRQHMRGDLHHREHSEERGMLIGAHEDHRGREEDKEKEGGHRWGRHGRHGRP